MSLNVLTNSMMATYRRCPREAYWTYVRALKPTKTPAALAFGTLFHLGRENWLLTGLDLEATLTSMRKNAGELSEFEAARCIAMFRGYHCRWESETREWEILAVEPTFKYREGERLRSGKIDAVIQHQGEVLINELKTTSSDLSPGAWYWQKLDLDSQISAYYMGARSLGYDPVGVCYDVARKPSLRPKKTKAYTETPEEFEQRCFEAIAANPEAYYGRERLVRFDAELNEASEEQRSWADKFFADVEAGFFPKNPDSCARFGSHICSYFSLCAGQASEDDFIKKGSTHEELA